MKLFACIKKEFLLIFRDYHALIVLFIMPLVFILIMSAALKNSFSGMIDNKYKVAFLSQKEINLNNPIFEVKNFTSETKMLDLSKNYDFIVKFDKKKLSIDIFAKAGISPQYINILKTCILLNLQEDLLRRAFGVGFDKNKFKFNSSFIDNFGKENLISSTDHNVPAWLVFSMFFILIPLSNTFINEKNFGTFKRLKTMNVSSNTILFGKFIPYFIINEIQVLLILIFGVYFMPFFSLASLQIKGSLWLIFLVTTCISFAAICFGLLIANIAKTSEEATTLGGISNIILAALGGIMVPIFVMPKFMQVISEFSPFNWALNALLGVLIKGDELGDIWAYLAKLCFFAFTCFIISYFLINKNKGK